VHDRTKYAKSILTDIVVWFMASFPKTKQRESWSVRTVGRSCCGSV